MVLADLLSERRRPPDAFWAGSLVSSRLLEYEVWNAIHRRRLAESRSTITRALLGGIALIELSDRVIGRARDAFPVPVRTLDGVHLATMLFLTGVGQEVRLACYDRRLVAAAQACGIEPSSDL